MVTPVQAASITSGYRVRNAIRRQCFRPLLELLEARVVFASDFGDAPLPYPTLLAEGGAEHVAIGPMLGLSRDTEADGAHSAGANGDDTTGIDDEDGVTFGEIRTGALGATATVTICCGPSKLDAWIDFNGDGAWGGPGEQIADTVSVNPGDNVISFDVPSWAVDGTTIARFRLSTGGNLGVDGVADDGEVEDHAVTLSPPKVACGCFGDPKNLRYSNIARGPNSVYAADVDGDGDTDMLSASGFDHKIAWYENNGSQAFVSHIISTSAVWAWSVYAADVDGDGDIDVLSASSVDNKIAWYENDGSQNFSTHIISTAALRARSVFAADVDGDGDIDILSASRDDDKIAWYENLGSQNFIAHTITAAANGAYSVFATDMDGDGDTDVLSASYVDDKIAWYENDGSQNFAVHTITTGANSARSVHAADVDSDGDIDVLSASKLDDKVAWYENDGSQNFTAHTITTGADEANSVHSADVDGDGDADVLSASPGDDKIAWYENDGSQNFTLRVVSTTADGAQSVYTADIDGDGDTDVLSASFADHKIAWYENDGSHNFTAHIVTTDAELTQSMFATDVDGDGDTDALSASYHDDQIAWYENDGSQNFTAHVITGAANGAQSVYAADMDGDGDTDVLSGTYFGGITWYENDGNQNFTSQLIDLDYAKSVYAADVDGDGDTDVVAAVEGRKIIWYENDGQNFTAHIIVDSMQGAASVHAADVDHDGDLDVLSASEHNDAILWYENDGSQNFTFHILPTAPNGPVSVHAADVDDDGDTDMIYASRLDNRVAWYENDGSQNFTQHVITSAAVGAASAYAADMDGDGDLDILSASSNNNMIAWYENDGSQNFTARTITTAADGARSVYAADVDGDGDLDVLSASAYDDRVAWYENLNFAVINTNDSGPGSLRHAIQQANANPGVDTITFGIGSGYKTIAPTSALPAITDAVIIDGTTQPGYAGAPLIEVWGLAAGPNVHGLVIAANDSTIKGIVVNLFSGNGILITGSGNRVENCYIGTDFSGTIGVPNALNGIEIIGGSGNTLGGADPSAANIIAFNDGRGVLIDTGTSNSIRQNSIQSNDSLGIDLINGGNNNQAAPIVTRWTSAGGTAKVWLTLTSTPNVTFSIDVFRNTVCDPSGFGEGEVFLGTAMLTTDAGGTGSIIAVFGVGVPLNQFITATATSPTNDTSEFSNCRPFRLKAPPTADSVTPLPLPIPPPPFPVGQRRHFGAATVRERSTTSPAP